MKPKTIKFPAIKFLATDVQFDCRRCAFKDKMYSCGMPCRLAAAKMGVPFTYAVLIKEPEKDYYGG